MNKRIILFTRYPEPGKCKKRLAKVIGDKNAAKVQLRMTLKAINVCNEYIKSHPECSLEIYYTGNGEYEMALVYGNYLYTRQNDETLGDRMRLAIKKAKEEGIDAVIIIGTDIPFFTYEHFVDSFDAIIEKDLVIIPAYDGGYCLIGMKEDNPLIFPGNMKWGEANVLERTLKLAKKARMKTVIMNPMHDIDSGDDLKHLEDTDILDDLPEPIVCVIIPALNEEANIAESIVSAGKSKGVEIIVSDGGSEDKTKTIANDLGARVIESKKGRSVQMNTAAIQAKAPILLFLHADTILPENYVYEICSILSMKNVRAGSFEIKIEGRNKALMNIEKSVNFRSRFLKMTYGDQGFFITKQVFNEIGGFPVIPIMEDYAIVKKIKKVGRMGISNFCVITSGRRWDKAGYMKTLIVNKFVFLGYKLGLNPDFLRRLYDKL